MADYELVLLKNITKPDSHTLRTYRAGGGYQALEKALRDYTPDEVVNLVKASDLRGRGGAGFPTGMKWSFLPKDRTKTIFCINADESEPPTFSNRVLMEQDPHMLLEGILISCYATRAQTAYIYLRYEYGASYRALQRAIDEGVAANLIGRNILGKDFSVEVYLHRGAGAYICGEETALLESLEGRRGWPRIKPPFPAVEGAFRKPTVVNNVETLANVPHIIERGPTWFKSIGPEKSYGPKLYCLSGHVNRPGCYEDAMGISLGELIEKYGGGIPNGRKPKMAIPGGLSMGVVTAAEFDMPMDFESPKMAPYDLLGLGTAAVTVIDETVPAVDVLYNSCRFFAHESCGQCTPCREGTGWMLKTFRRIKEGGGRIEDLDIMLDLADNMGLTPGTTICGLADGAAWMLRTGIRKFRAELEAMIRAAQPSLTAEQVAIERQKWTAPPCEEGLDGWGGDTSGLRQSGLPAGRDLGPAARTG